MLLLPYCTGRHKHQFTEVLHSLPVIIFCHTLYFLFVPVGDTKCDGWQCVLFCSCLSLSAVAWL